MRNVNRSTAELVIFDLDGTLVDSLDDLADSMNAVLASRNFPTHPRAPYRRFVGDGIVNLVRRALPPEAVTEELVTECVDHMRAEYDRRQRDTTEPFPGVTELLEASRKRGLKTAVLSNKPDPATRNLVAALFPHHDFEAVFGARPGVPLKPDPSAALEIAAALSILPESTVYVGDTDTDMITGRRAGMITVGVTWGFRDEHELRQSGARYIIHHPLDLLGVLSSEA
jgi:phosphoglycolate phosphatase